MIPEHYVKNVIMHHNRKFVDKKNKISEETSS